MGHLIEKGCLGVISGYLHVYALNYTLEFNTYLKKKIGKKPIIAKLYFLKPIHVQKRTLRNNSLKFDKRLMLDVDICAHDVLVLQAQPFAIELSTSHFQQIDCNNCTMFGQNIAFLALFALTKYREFAIEQINVIFLQQHRTFRSLDLLQLQ